MAQPWIVSRAAVPSAFAIHAGMSADRSFSNSAELRAAAIVVTVSGVTLFLPRYQRAESATPVASRFVSPANRFLPASQHRRHVPIHRLVRPASRLTQPMSPAPPKNIFRRPRLRPVKSSGITRRRFRFPKVFERRTRLRGRNKSAHPSHWPFHDSAGRPSYC